MSRSGVAARRGFTVVELLVATAILGILISAVIALTSSFLGYSRRVSVINERLTDLNDVMGYVALNTRRAMRVVGEGNSVSITPQGGTQFTCSVDEPEPCFALVVPVTNTSTAAIDGYDFVAYRVAPLSAWGANPGIPGGWNGQATPALFEYSVALCTGCTAPPAISGTSVTGARTSLVMPNLFLERDAAPGIEYAPFEITGEVGSGTGVFSRITIRLRTRGSGLEDGVRVPAGEPLELLTVRRP